MKLGFWTIDDKIFESSTTKQKIPAICDCGAEKLVQKGNMLRGLSTNCGCKKNIIKPGDTFGYWTAIKPDTKNIYIVQCVCGKITKRQRSALKSGHTKSCGCVNKIKVNGIKKYFLTAISDSYTENNRQYIKVKCDCGTEKSIILESFTSGHTKSCGCAKQLLRKTTNKQKYGVEYASQLLSVKEKYKQTCLDRYGYVNYSQTPEARQLYSNILLDNTKKGYSRGEEELRSWVAEIIGYIPEKTRISENSIVREIDIYIPTHNIGIEYNGLIFHHSEPSHSIGAKDKNYHLNKTNMFKKHGHLIHIWDVEWEKNKDKVKTFILSKLQKGIPVRASKCVIQKIPENIAKDFCKKYHLQGSPKSIIFSIGLFYDNQLLSVMTFSKPHRQNMNGTPHMSRYAIATGYRVHGGLSKMSQFAYKHIGTFLTFVHKRLSDGVSYEKAGYCKMKDLPPDYFYYDFFKKNIVSKQSRQKKKVNTPDGMTEYEHAFIDGLVRVYDCGKIKFIYNP